MTQSSMSSRAARATSRPAPNATPRPVAHACAMLVLGLAATAQAQTPPTQLDRVEVISTTPLPGLELRREQDRLLLQLEQDRAREQRERDLLTNALPNTRVPATSTAVVSQPEAYLLPPAPPGKYYARISGRFVIVDATSELVEQVLPVQITDPTADVPAGPRPLPSVDMSLPLRRVAPTSALVIANPASLALPAPPAGQYYARVDGKIVLVEARTELPVKVIRAG